MDRDRHAPAAAAATSRIGVVIRYVTFVGISAHAGFIALFLWLELPAMAVFNVASVGAWVVARAVNHRGRIRLATLLIGVEVVAHAALATRYLGWRSGFHYYLIPLAVFVVFNDQMRTRTVVGLSVALIAFYVGLRALAPDLPLTDERAMVLRALEALNVVIPFVALLLISVYFRAASIEVERLMANLAMTDALTALPNRRHMQDVLERARAQAARSQRGFALVIGDLDGFKQINDSLGHECGDQVLRAVAAVLRGKLRAQDAVARWGGEEFLFLLPETDLAGAGVVAEKLRDAVAAAAITFEGQRVPVTMTFGVSTSAPSRSVDDCVRLADAALYSGKGHGKNRVVLEAHAA